jgi:hypothetical protein
MMVLKENRFLCCFLLLGVTIDKDFQISLEDSTSRATDKAKEALSGCMDITDINELTSCLTKQAEAAIDKEKQDIAFQATIRKSMGEQLSDYSCGNFVTTDQSSTTSISPILLRPVKVTTTPSIRNDTYNNELVQVLFESDYSNVQLYENFLTVNDCDEVLNSNGTGVTLSIKNKINKLLLHNDILQTIDIPPPLSENYHVTVLSGPEFDEPNLDCEVDTDGSCITNNIPSQAPVYVVEKTKTDDTIAARVVLTCVKSSSNSIKKENVTSSNTTDDDDDSLSSFTPSGMIYFIKAGVRIVPTDRSAILIQYDEASDDDIILREPDPFLDEHILCPVTEPNMTVATIMYNVTH